MCSVLRAWGQKTTVKLIVKLIFLVTSRKIDFGASKSRQRAPKRHPRRPQGAPWQKSVARKKSWNHCSREPNQVYLTLAEHVRLLTETAVRCPPTLVAWRTLWPCSDTSRKLSAGFSANQFNHSKPIFGSKHFFAYWIRQLGKNSWIQKVKVTLQCKISYP